MSKIPHILVVEDDADVAAYLRIVLEKRGGFQVTHTIDPLEPCDGWPRPPSTSSSPTSNSRG